MKRLLFTLLMVVFFCSGFAWLESFFQRPVSEVKEEIVEEVVIDNQDEIEDTIDKTSKIQWLDDRIIITQKDIRRLYYREIDNGYKISFTIYVGESYEQFHFFRITYDLNGFDDNNVAIFDGDDMIINPRFISPANSMSLGTWWLMDNGKFVYVDGKRAVDWYEVKFDLFILTEDHVIYHDFVQKYEEWK